LLPEGKPLLPILVVEVDFNILFTAIAVLFNNEFLERVF